MRDFLRGFTISLIAMGILTMPFLLAFSLLCRWPDGVIGVLCVATMLAHIAICAFINDQF